MENDKYYGLFTTWSTKELYLWIINTEKYAKLVFKYVERYKKLNNPNYYLYFKKDSEKWIKEINQAINCKEMEIKAKNVSYHEIWDALLDYE